MKFKFYFLAALFAFSCNADEAPTSHLNHWYALPSSDLVTLDTQQGNIVFALSPTLAPTHVTRFKQLVSQGFFNNQYFYRVIDGFVAQGGSNGTHPTDTPGTTPIAAEFVIPLSAKAVVIENQDMFAPATGLVNGFLIGADKNKNEMWGLHCPGTLAFARDVEKDTASTEFYAVIGQAPRHLDRNMSVIGKVVEGMPVLQGLVRGNMDKGGVLDVMEETNKIISATLGAERPYFIQRSNHPEYQQRINTAKFLDNPFFHDNIYGPRAIDVCYHQPKVASVPW